MEVFEFRDVFEEKLVNPFVKLYLEGKTPSRSKIKKDVNYT
jgi:tRNA U34 2-thiouridine synthase MnmA/TrmU